MLKAMGLQRIQTKGDKPLAESMPDVQKGKKKGKKEKKGCQEWPAEWPHLAEYSSGSECGDNASEHHPPHSKSSYSVIPEGPELHRSPAWDVGLSSSSTPGQYKSRGNIPPPKDRRKGPRPVTDSKGTAKAKAGGPVHAAGESYTIRQGPSQPRQPALPPAVPAQNVSSSRSADVINYKIGGRPKDCSKNAVNTQAGRGGTSGRQPAPPPAVPPSPESGERTRFRAGNPEARHDHSDVGVQTPTPPPMKFSDLVDVPGPAKCIRWAEDVADATLKKDRKRA